MPIGGVTAYARGTPKVEYDLTEKGKTLIPILASLMDWGRAHALPQPQDVRQAPEAPAP
jgi:DNA-binding HxlR family transcriptional regulator